MDYAFKLEGREDSPKFIYDSSSDPWNYKLFETFCSVLLRNKEIISGEYAENILDGWNAASRSEMINHIFIF